MLFEKKRERIEKMACQRRMTQKKGKGREKKREKRWHAKEA